MSKRHTSNQDEDKDCCKHENIPSGCHFFSYRKDGTKYTPNYSEAVDHQKCIGCGECVRVCGQGVYVLLDVSDNKKAHNANAGKCLGDCHCHKVCPVDALICKPRIL